MSTRIDCCDRRPRPADHYPPSSKLSHCVPFQWVTPILAHRRNHPPRSPGRLCTRILYHPAESGLTPRFELGYRWARLYDLSVWWPVSFLYYLLRTLASTPLLYARPFYDACFISNLSVHNTSLRHLRCQISSFRDARAHTNQLHSSFRRDHRHQFHSQPAHNRHRSSTLSHSS